LCNHPSIPTAMECHCIFNDWLVFGNDETLHAKQMCPLADTPVRG
jgi:hypothetical protein